MKKFLLLSIICVICSSFSCTYKATLGTISTRNIDYSARYEKDGEAFHKANLLIVLSIPVYIQDQYMVEIIDMAMIESGYEFMTDVKVKATIIPAFLVNYFSVEIEGIGWKEINTAADAKEMLKKEKVCYKVNVTEGDKFDLERLTSID